MSPANFDVLMISIASGGLLSAFLSACFAFRSARLARKRAAVYSGVPVLVDWETFRNTVARDLDHKAVCEAVRAGEVGSKNGALTHYDQQGRRWIRHELA